MAAGGAIGLNRDLRGKPAGVRTHSLVAIGAALMTVIVLEWGGNAADRGQMLSRTVQGIVTGIGFLGAGVILRPSDGHTVRGLTTAATIWVTAALGIACGVGAWRQAAIATALTLLVLMYGGPLERLGRRLKSGPLDEADTDDE
jgi:putative Mg2+ transporter-C (MgtC) family protein